MTSDYLLHIAAMIAIFLRAKNLGIAIKMKNKRMIWKESLIIALVVCVWIIVYRANAPQAADPKSSVINKTDSSGKPEGLYIAEGDSVLLPPFDIEITLSDKARQRITGTDETIIIDIFLQGEPKDSAHAHYEEDGSFFVGSASREIRYGQVAHFDNVRFPKKTYDELANKDVDLSVNVYTGRRSSGNNLITGDFLADKASRIINKRFTLQYRLIDEDQ